MSVANAEKWLRDTGNEMFLSGVVGASGKLLYDLMENYSKHLGAAQEWIPCAQWKFNTLLDAARLMVEVAKPSEGIMGECPTCGHSKYDNSDGSADNSYHEEIQHHPKCQWVLLRNAVADCEVTR